MKKKFSKLSLLLSVALFSNISFSQDNRNYFPLVGGDSYVGYKERYSPIGGLTNIGGGISSLISSHNNIPYQKIKIFIPPGTKGLGVGLLTSMGSQESKMAARFKSPPIATAENINVNTGILDPNISLELLINGASSNKELYFYSPPNSGTLSTFRYNSRSTYQTDTGGYIYLNTLSIPGSYIKSLQATLTIDEACYRSWYANAQWDAQDNPDENATHTCAGSTGGGTVVPPLEKILLSYSMVGTENIITAKPHPVGAKLPLEPVCAATTQNLEPKTPSDTAAEFTVTATTPVTAPTTFTIDCGSDKTASLILYPDSDQIKDKNSTADADGNFLLNFKLKRPDTELVATNKTNFWVAALLPKTSFPYMNDEEEWFFFTPSGWTSLNSINPLSVAYQIDQAPTAETSFRIPTGLPQAIAEVFNAELHFGYMGADDIDLKNMGIIWKKN